MNKWVARGRAGFVDIKVFPAKEGSKRGDTTVISWSMGNQVGEQTNYYNLKSYNKSIIKNLKNGMDIELLDYEIRVNSWQDQNTLEKKKSVFFLVREIKLISAGNADENYGFVYDKANYQPENYTNNVVQQIDRVQHTTYDKEADDEIVNLDWDNLSGNELEDSVRAHQLRQNLALQEMEELQKQVSQANALQDLEDVIENTPQTEDQIKADSFEVEDGWE